MAYAVPSDAGLAALANLGLPLIECGAGTGYWASLLRRRGVTVAAFDIAPNKTAAMLAAGGGGKGGAPPSHNEYHAEVRSLPSPANCHPSLCLLLLALLARHSRLLHCCCNSSCRLLWRRCRPGRQCCAAERRPPPAAPPPSTVDPRRCSCATHRPSRPWRCSACGASLVTSSHTSVTHQPPPL